jgi:L-threonylcarbamoyladenylate synthase
VAETGKNTELAADLLTQGKLVAIPTETVYGLAANALNEKAILSVFEAKNRPFFDPLIIHVASKNAVESFAELSDPRLIKLAETFWPGPLTLLLPKKEIIPDIVTSGLKQVAVRVPNHVLTQELLKKIPFPLAAPSANPFGYISPTEPAHVNKQLGNKVSYILDGGACTVGLESTIVGIENEQVCVYRLGGLDIESIENCVGPVQILINSSSNPKVPGQLKSHYAPKKPLFLGKIGELLTQHSDKKSTLICFGNTHTSKPGAEVFNLSPSADLNEAALNLFKFLRLADESDSEIVLCEILPEKGLGKAINDRLRRAATRD